MFNWLKKDMHLTGGPFKLLRRERHGDGANVAWVNVVESEAQRVGDISDGHHTFNELYEHRNVLFVQILNSNKELSFKTKCDHNKDELNGWFLGGINTPMGQASYHLPMSLWKQLDVQELDFFPEYDGHSAIDALYRIQSLVLTDWRKG